MSDKRLIDANALKKRAMEMEIFQPYGGDGTVMAVTVDSIDFAPTIDAVEVVHARWIREPRGVVRCSYCDKGYRLTNGGANVLKFFYCPNCGAKMDAKEG